MTSLNKVALVGTARWTETTPTGTPVDELLSRVARLTPEARLLLAAGMLSIYRRAGYVPDTIASLPAPAPPETLPACSPGAARALGDMFLDGRLELLPEAFELLAGARQRVPSSLLVHCLDLRDRVHRDAARPVLGERGVWLAHQREAWEWARSRVALEPDPSELVRTWHEGRTGERLAAIARVRDLDPTLARDLIAAAWKQEPGEFRASLISAIGQQLGPADEGLLQTALRDRAGAVRAAAAALLARLPGSTFADRAVARAGALLDLTEPRGVGDRVKGVARQDHPLAVTARPPEGFEPEWEADGMSLKPPRGVGERAHWLMQAVALVDPSHWSGRAGVPPSELTRAAWRGEWGTAVMIAWSRAALTHNSPTWIVALWDAWLGADVSSDPTATLTRRELLVQLFRQMPADAAHERIATLLQAPALAADLDVETMLDRFDRPWPDAVAIPVLDAIDSATATDAGLGARASQLAGLLRTAGPAVPAPSFDRALALGSRESVRTIGERVTHEFDVFSHQIRLRQRLHQEIQ